MKNTRFGRIKIARKYIEDYLDMVLKVMARCVIVRCDVFSTVRYKSNVGSF